MNATRQAQSYRARGRRGGGRGERRGAPWRTYFDPEALERDLATVGFGAVARLTPARAAERYYGGQPADVTPFTVWQVVAAVV